MSCAAKGPPPWHGRGPPLKLSSFGDVDGNEAPKTVPAQENLLLEAIKALSAEEIRDTTFENVPLTLAASGWRSTAALLVHAAKCVDAGDFSTPSATGNEAASNLSKQTTHSASSWKPGPSRPAPGPSRRRSDERGTFNRYTE